jgi:hypothetical protein
MGGEFFHDLLIQFVFGRRFSSIVTSPGELGLCTGVVRSRGENVSQLTIGKPEANPLLQLERIPLPIQTFVMIRRPDTHKVKNLQGFHNLEGIVVCRCIRLILPESVSFLFRISAGLPVSPGQEKPGQVKQLTFDLRESTKGPSSAAHAATPAEWEDVIGCGNQ